ncbi:hypothetical protein P3L10_003603 [Capsicum annuum]
MELLSAIVKECTVSVNIPLEINLLEQLQPELARQERMLKIRSNINESIAECSRMNEGDASIKNNRCKFTKMMKLTNFSGRHDSIHQNGHYTTNWNFGHPKYTCQYCGALLWYEERKNKIVPTKNQIFSFCCMEGGRVQLPLLSEPPTYLKYLLGTESGKVGTHFRKNIRAYNSIFAFTSMGGRVDGSINRSKGPYIFRRNGQNYHHIGSLLPEIGKTPRFAQLYIYDTENKITNRMNYLSQGEFDLKIVQALSEMLDEHNILENFQRDIIVEHRKNGLQRITDLHPSFMSMTYPLIHPFGEDRYRLGINLVEVNNKTHKRQNLSMREFYCFRIQQRLNGGHTLLMAGKSIILPFLHTGGPRYRAQNYQDAMAICRWAGYPDLFLTFTCNPKWPEINEMLHLIGQHDDDNRVDIICSLPDKIISTDARSEKTTAFWKNNRLFIY